MRGLLDLEHQVVSQNACRTERWQLAVHTSGKLILSAATPFLAYYGSRLNMFNIARNINWCDV